MSSPQYTPYLDALTEAMKQYIKIEMILEL